MNGTQIKASFTWHRANGYTLLKVRLERLKIHFVGERRKSEDDNVEICWYIFSLFKMCLSSDRHWLARSSYITYYYKSICTFCTLHRIQLTLSITASGLPTASSPKSFSHRMPSSGIASRRLSASPGNRERMVTWVFGFAETYAERTWMALPPPHRSTFINMFDFLIEVCC